MSLTWIIGVTVECFRPMGPLYVKINYRFGTKLVEELSGVNVECLCVGGF